MGKAIGAVAGGIAQDLGIRSGVEKGRAGYNAASGQYAAGKEEGLGYLQPYADVGGGALSPLSALLTGRSYDQETGEFTQLSPEERFSSFEASPGYQFRLDEGLKAVQNAQSARGKSGLGGGALKELTQYGQGLASSEYGNYINNLMGLSNIGQSAAGQSSNLAYNTAGRLGSSEIGSGNLAMQGRIARGSNQADVFNTLGGLSGGGGGAGAGAAGAGGAGGFASLFAAMSDKNLKENIEEVGKSESGIPIYHFDYKDKSLGEFRYEGVMAQDLLELKPEAVSEKDGYLMVDYSKIDINFKRI